MTRNRMQNGSRLSRRRGERGQAMVEVTLLAPWIFFLFIGILDTGWFCYSAICTENAARAAAVMTGVTQGQVAGTSNNNACMAAWNEMSNLPNIYSSTPVTTCAGLPSVLTVVTNTLCGSKTTGIATCTAGNTCSDCDGTTQWDGYTPPAAAQDNTAASAQVIVTYTSVPVVPIPGIFPSKLTITRIAEARIIQE